MSDDFLPLAPMQWLSAMRYVWSTGDRAEVKRMHKIATDMWPTKWSMFVGFKMED